jgi:5-methylcytosine-specific restriction protein A
VAKYSFLNGAPYSRRDVFTHIGLNPIPRWGQFLNGYFENNGAHFVFCNVGTPGRTGHDYPNRFVGDNLLWRGKTKAKREHASIRRMTASSAEVHIFFRVDNRDRFTYLGRARAIEVDDAVPVEVLWEIIDDGYVGEERPTLPQLSQSLNPQESVEGKMVTVEVNRYERSAAARAQCISHFGTACSICGFDFEKTYGSMGAGFIHVHHLIPLSQIGQSYLVDPTRDLVPVCPNCHAMLHRETPPLPVTELRARIIREDRAPQ